MQADRIARLEAHIRRLEQDNGRLAHVAQEAKEEASASFTKAVELQRALAQKQIECKNAQRQLSRQIELLKSPESESNGDNQNDGVEDFSN